MVRPVAPFAVLSLLMCALVAGCLGDDVAPPVAPPEVFVDPMAFTEGHDHADHAQHDLSWNMTELGWDRLGDLPVAWGEIDTHPDHDIGLVAFAWPTAGFATVDLSDPANLSVLDVIDLGHGYGADVKWAPHGVWAVVAIQTHSSRGLPSPVPDPVASTAESGIELFHVTDAGEIHDVDAWTPAPDRGIHMVYTARIGGLDHVFAAYNGKGVGVYRIETGDAPVGARLVPVNGVFPLDPMGIAGAPTTAGLAGAHDMTVIHDPILDKPLLWVAHGYQGLWVYDVSDPGDPLWPDRPLGHWTDPDNTWYMHTVQAQVDDEGTRRVILAPEVFSDAEAEVVAPLWVLDATDLSDIRTLGTWRNPGDHGAEQLRYSVHNFQLVDDKVVLAHYHGGVWVLDLAANGTMRPVGYHLPANDPDRPMSGIYHGVYNMEDAPTVWDVVVHKGVIYASDVNSGLYALATPDWMPGDVTVQSLG